MNERIKELFKQTALHRNDHTTEQRIYEVEKFAELIVQECLNIIHDEVQYVLDQNTASSITSLVKKHFWSKAND